MLGSTLPRIWTPPLVTGPPGPCPCGCALTELTSFGFEVIDFARDVLMMTLDPWQRFALIHLGELLPDGRPRFRRVLIIVARQSGKTELIKALLKWWLFMEQVPLVLAMSTDRQKAKETFKEIIEEVKENDSLALEVGPDAERKLTGEEAFTTLAGARYQFAANTRKAGRGKTVRRLWVDELREHRDWEAWNSATKAMNAVPAGQIVVTTNQGDDQGVVLDSLLKSARKFIETGKGNYRFGLLEWSAPDNASPTDPAALAMANPGMGYVRPDGGGITLDTLMGDAIEAEEAGGEELTKFKTEIMCIRVRQLDAAIGADAWAACGTDTPLNLAEHRDRLALVVDVSLDERHAALIGGAWLPTGETGDDGQPAFKLHLEVIEQWEGHGCTLPLRKQLPGLVKKIRPRAWGRFRNGPIKAVVADLLPGAGRAKWVPRGTETVEITAEQAMEAWMELAELVRTGQVVHPNDPMLTQHVLGAAKRYIGEGWVGDRQTAGGPIDGGYGAAGAGWAARRLKRALAPVESA